MSAFKPKQKVAITKDSVLADVGPFVTIGNYAGNGWYKCIYRLPNGEDRVITLSENQLEAVQ
jgi:hypothetical protein